jgi:general stress protein 26
MADLKQAYQKLWDMIQDIHVALMVTHDEHKQMHARPMASITPSSKQDFNGELWFFTSARSPKLAEIARDPSVLLSYAEPKKQNYVSIRGTAHQVNDRAKIEALWSEPMRVWFPKGSADPDIALIRVQAESAEYWDSPSATFVMLYGYAKARLTGERPDIGDNRKVAF